MFKKYTLLIFVVILSNSQANGMSWVKSLFGAKVSQPIDPESLIPRIEDALSAKNFREASKLMMHYRIRVRMDAACCTDASASAAMTELTFRQITDPRFAEISMHVSRAELAHSGLDVANQIGDELSAGSLPQPEWVAKYGMNKFLRCSDEPGLFIPRSECAKKQKEFIRKYKQEMVEVIAEESSK